VSAPRFLVDENLSILLPEVAHARGYEATHINHYGLRKSKDWDILKVVAEEDWVLITNNAFEFRSRYQRLELSRCRRMAQSLASGAAGEFQTGPSTGGRSICSPVVALNQNAR
jgi:Domain of unknown function (DUF5615)